MVFRYGVIFNGVIWLDGGYVLMVMHCVVSGTVWFFMVLTMTRWRLRSRVRWDVTSSSIFWTLTRPGSEWVSLSRTKQVCTGEETLVIGITQRDMFDNSLLAFLLSSTTFLLSYVYRDCKYKFLPLTLSLVYVFSLLNILKRSYFKFFANQTILMDHQTAKEVKGGFFTQCPVKEHWMVVWDFVDTCQNSMEILVVKETHTWWARELRRRSLTDVSRVTWKPWRNTSQTMLW